MRTILVVLCLLATPAFAAKDPCAPKHHRPHPATCQPAPKPETCLWKQIKTGFEFEGGFRWEEEHVCPTPQAPPPPPKHVDPFFIGAGVRLPLNDQVSAFGFWDRDATDAPHWQARAGLSWNPFR